MENTKYYITQEQLDSLEHNKDMFALNADRISDLCKSGKDDIVYGFELGQIYSHLRECFKSMMELEDEIKQQEVLPKTYSGFECENQ